MYWIPALQQVREKLQRESRNAVFQSAYPDLLRRYKMSPYMTGFTPNYREDMAVKVNFIENGIFVLIYKIK